MRKRTDQELTNEFKTNLKRILEDRKGKTNPKRLSREAGLGETAVRDILQNRSHSPRLDTIQKLAKALNVPIYRLIPSMIDQSYEEIQSLREENYALREAIGDDEFEDANSLTKAAQKRSE